MAPPPHMVPPALSTRELMVGGGVGGNVQTFERSVHPELHEMK